MDQLSGLDRLYFDPATDEQAVGDKPERRDIHQARALIDQVNERRVIVGISPRPIVTPGLPIDDPLRPAVLQADPSTVTSTDRNGPLLALGSPPVEAGRERTI